MFHQSGKMIIIIQFYFNNQSFQYWSLFGLWIKIYNHSEINIWRVALLLYVWVQNYFNTLSVALFTHMLYPLPKNIRDVNPNLSSYCVLLSVLGPVEYSPMNTWTAMEGQMTGWRAVKLYARLRMRKQAFTWISRRTTSRQENENDREIMEAKETNWLSTSAYMFSLDGQDDSTSQASEIHHQFNGG